MNDGRPPSLTLPLTSLPPDNTQRGLIIVLVRADGSSTFVSTVIPADLLLKMHEPDVVERVVRPAFAALKDRDADAISASLTRGLSLDN